jgi:transposase-like protein
MKEKKVTGSTKLTKIGRSYSESIKRKIVGEINSGLISHRTASKKYGVNRKSIGNWITQFSLVNLRPLEIAQNTMVDIKDETKTRILAKQVLDLTKELEKAKLKISSLETMIEVSEQDLHIKIRKKPGAKQSKE